MSAPLFVSQRFEIVDEATGSDGGRCCARPAAVLSPGRARTSQVQAILGVQHRHGQSRSASRPSTTGDSVVGHPVELQLGRTPQERIRIGRVKAVLLTKQSYWSPEHREEDVINRTSETELGRRIQVAIAGSGPTGQTPWRTETAIARVQLQLDDAAGGSFEASCLLAEKNDWQCVATLTIDSAAYKNTQQPIPPKTISAWADANGIGTPRTETGEVTIHTYRPLERPADANPSYISAELPHTTLYPETVFKLRIYATTARPLASVRLQIEVEPTGLEILAIEMSKERPETPWSPTLGRRIETQAVLSAIRDDRQLNSTGLTELLCTVTIRVRAEAKPSSPGGGYKYSMSVLKDSNSDGLPMLTSNTKNAFVSYRVGGGAINNPNVGYVHVADPSEPAAIFATVLESSSMTNVAVLNGKAVSADIVVTRVLRSGQPPSHLDLIAEPGLVKCDSNQDIVSTTPDCSAVRLLGSEIKGGRNVPVKFEYGGLSSDVTLDIYYPELPGRLRVDVPNADETDTVPVLRRIDEWTVPVPGPGSKNCSSASLNRYQQFELQLLVRFSLVRGDTNARFEADFTADVVDGFTASNTSVARIEVLTSIRSTGFEKYVVRGNLPGTTTISVSFGSIELGSTRVKVVDFPAVSMTDIFAVPAKQYSAELVPNQSSDLTFAELCTEPAGSSFVKLTHEQDQTEIFTMLQFNDTSTMQITADHGVYLTSMFPDTIEILDDKFAAVKVNPRNQSLRRRPIVRADWMPECEVPQGLRSALAQFEFDLIDAIDVSVVPTPVLVEARLHDCPDRTDCNLLTRPNNSAEAAGVPSAVSLDVTLTYPHPTGVKSVSIDRRTIVDCDGECTTRLNVTRSYGPGGQIILSVLPDAPPGIAKVYINFEQGTADHLSAAVTFEVAIHDRFDLSVVPYPRFDDDFTHDASQLRPIAGTSPLTYEQSELTCAMILNNEMRLTLKDRPIAGLSLPTNSTVSFVTTGEASSVELLPPESNRNDQILIAGRAPGKASVHCRFAWDTTENSGHSKLVTVYACEPNCACVKSFTEYFVEQPSRQRGPLSAGLALRGLINDTAHSNVAVELSDGRRYSEITPFKKWLPGLFRFESTAKASAVIEAETGLVRLRGNSETVVEFTVTTKPDSSCLVGAVRPTYRGSVQPKSTELAANLDPFVGDIDLGNVSAIALPSASLQEPIEVDVWINVGEKLLGIFDIELQFTAGVLDLDGQICVARGASDCPDGSAALVLEPDLRAPCAKVEVEARIAGSLRVIGLCSEKGAVSCGSDGRVTPGCNVHGTTPHRSIHLGKVRFRRGKDANDGDRSRHNCFMLCDCSLTCLCYKSWNLRHALSDGIVTEIILNPT